MFSSPSSNRCSQTGSVGLLSAGWRNTGIPPRTKPGRSRGEVVLMSELRAAHLRVQTVASGELIVRASLDDASLVDDDDLIGGSDRCEPVGDDDRCASLQ